MYLLHIPIIADTLTESVGPLRKVSDTLFAGNSLIILVVAIILGVIAGKLASSVLRWFSRGFSKRAEVSTNLQTANRMRRIETWLILSIALVRTFFIILALYFWWVITHPTQRPTALVGASALFAIVLGGVFSPLLRDFAYGGSMMAEHWFGVGDLITIEPASNIRGVVERITLRSTRIRGLNGEVIWMSNQSISGVRIAQKGVWTMAIELFVTDPDAAEELVEQTNALLPMGPLLVSNPLAIMSKDERDEGLWHMTAITEIAPGREWLVEKTAIDLLKKLDERSKTPVLITDPVSRFADNDSERQFARAVKIAQKKRRVRRKLALNRNPETRRRRPKY